MSTPTPIAAAADATPKTTSPAAPPAARGGGTIERRKDSSLRQLGIRFTLFVLLPTLVAAGYYGMVASDIYVSETRFAIRSSGQKQADGFLAAIFAAGGGGSAEDTIVVRDYAHSREMLGRLNEALNIRSHYSSTDVDRLSRLPADATNEQFLDYYRDMVQVVLETGTGIITLTARAFTPEMARDINERLVADSEQLINHMSDRIRDDTLALVREELDLAEQRVRAASATITDYRQRTKLVDPTQETGAVLGIISELEARLATARAELSAARSFMQPDSARVRTLNANVAALETQVKLERGRLVSGDSADLTGRIDGYLPLALDQEFAQQQYASVLASFELARAEVQRKQQYLVPFVKPDLPLEAREPERVKGVLTVFVGALLIYAFSSLIVAGFKDHAGL